MRQLAALLCLTLVGHAPGSMAGEPLVPGADLGALVEGGAAAGQRYGLNGAPPGAPEVLPAAPVEPGPHWLVAYTADGAPQAWYRFRVAGEPSALRPVAIAVDARHPLASIRLEGPWLELDGRIVAGVGVELQVEAEDDAGGIEIVLLVDGQPLPAGARWTQRDDGPVQLSLVTSDALGNRGKRAASEIWLDRTPPRLEWRRLDAREGVPDDVFDGRRARLSLQAGDALAGVQRLGLGGRSYTAEALAGGLTVDVDAAALDYFIEDQVGNRAEGSIALRADTEGPRFVATRNGEPVELEDARLRRSDAIRLDAEDALSGVARACVEASIWYGSCRPLPIDLVGLAPGRYQLEFRAADRLGNRSLRRLPMEVLP